MFFGSPEPDIEVTFVGAGAAAHTYVHENLERAVLVESFPEPSMMIFFQSGAASSPHREGTIGGHLEARRPEFLAFFRVAEIPRV